MLERFAHHALPDACPRERQALEELLSLPDPVLAAYLLGESTPPEPHLAALAGAIRAYVAKEGGSALFSTDAELSGEVTVYSAHGTAAL